MAQIAITQTVRSSIKSKNAKSSKIIHDKIIIISEPNISKICISDFNRTSIKSILVICKLNFIFIFYIQLFIHDFSLQIPFSGLSMKPLRFISKKHMDIGYLIFIYILLSYPSANILELEAPLYQIFFFLTIAIRSDSTVFITMVKH